jgi:hypothetical protein
MNNALRAIKPQSGDKMDKWRSAPIKAASQPIKSFYLFYHFYPFYPFYRREAATLSFLSPRSAIYRCEAALSSRSDRCKGRK